MKLFCAYFVHAVTTLLVMDDVLGRCDVITADEMEEIA